MCYLNTVISHKSLFSLSGIIVKMPSGHFYYYVGYGMQKYVFLVTFSPVITSFRALFLFCGLFKPNAFWTLTLIQWVTAFWASFQFCKLCFMQDYKKTAFWSLSLIQWLNAFIQWLNAFW